MLILAVCYILIHIPLTINRRKRGGFLHTESINMEDKKVVQQKGKETTPSIISLEKWLEKQRAALREEREEEKLEVTTALAQLSPQVRRRELEG